MSAFDSAVRRVAFLERARREAAEQIEMLTCAAPTRVAAYLNRHESAFASALLRRLESDEFSAALQLAICDAADAIRVEIS